MAYAAILFSVLVIAAGQIMFKFAALRFTGLDGKNFLATLSANSASIALIACAMALYAVSTIGWIYALRTVPLSQAYVFNALSFVLVPLAAVVLFGERLDVTYLFGTAAVIAGICLIALR